LSGGGLIGYMTVVNSTISGNGSDSVSGGGISNAGSLTVNNSTITANTARNGGGINNVYNPGFTSLQLSNSIVAGNSAWLGGPDCKGASMTSLGHNLIGNTGGCDFPTAPGDLTNVSAELDVLADNGGPTQTHALLESSPAIDAGSSATPGTGGEACELADQRGVVRPQGFACDIGAFEFATLDTDQDGVPDNGDLCPDTMIPESVPTNNLGVNRWALVDDDDMFDTTPPPGGGGGPDFAFTVAATGGCSCEQIIEAWALGWGHTKFGCSTGAMLQWIAYVGDYSLAEIENEPRQTTGGQIQTPIESGDKPSASTQGTVSDPPPRRQQSLTPRRSPRPHNNRN
jgi:hypothetical protein